MINLKLHEKKIKYQQDFKDLFKHWDKLCNYLAVVRAIEINLNTLFTLQETESVLKDLIAIPGCLSAKGGLPNGNSYLMMAKMFGKLREKSLAGYQTGFVRDDQAISWKGDEPEFNFIQLKWKTARGNQHWTLGDKDGNEIYDAYLKDDDPGYAKESLDKQYLLLIKEV